MSELILDKEKQKVKPPSMWNVIFHNDDFSSFELVIVVMMEIFNKTSEQAQRFALEVHEKGKGVAGTYPKDIAETKQTLAMETAQLNDMPLMITLEEV